MPQKPFAQACENNKDPILQVICRYLEQYQQVFEIGSGTGQHAVYFAKMMPCLTWQTSDLKENHAGIQAWINDSGLDNVLPPLELDVSNTQQWPTQIEALYTANSTHIMPWEAAQQMMAQAGQRLQSGGVFLQYGAFKFDGEFTTDSNRKFDLWLKQQHSFSGIRDFEAVEAIANANGLTLEANFDMPANNQLLVWRKA